MTEKYDTEDLKVNDIIQIISHENPIWISCLFIVDEVKKWGCQAYLRIPKRGERGDCYMRFKFEEFFVVGKALDIYAKEFLEVTEDGA